MPFPEPSPEDPERALLARLQSGDDAAYEEFVRTHSPKMLSVARRLLEVEEDARDVVQEAFVNAFRSIGRFQGESRFATWLHRITINAALMKLRRRRRKPEEPIETLLPSFETNGHRVLDGPDDAVDIDLERQETREAVRAAIHRLPESYRNILMLRDIEELSTEEVAQLLGVTGNAVKIRLHRARQALKTLLAPPQRGGTEAP